MKNNWKNPGTNRFKNDINVLRKKAGGNLDEYIQNYILSAKEFIRSFLEDENEEK